ncbi:MAG: histidine kinase, partial [Planctomycetes bacterium]|nr:histidine kinase [Planctomycetota bacterium]
LHNIVKHAEAEHVVVRLQRDGRTLVLQVQDRGAGFDSCGFDFRVSTSGGFGLFNIRERLQRLGGSCAVRSTPGAGTEVTLTTPLQAPHAPNQP